MAKLTRRKGESEEDFKKRINADAQNTDVADGLSLDKDSDAYKEMVAERQGKDAEVMKREAQGKHDISAKQVAKGAMKAASVAHKVHGAGKVIKKVGEKTALFSNGTIGLTGNIAEQLSDSMTTTVETPEQKAERLAKRRDAKIPKEWSEPQKQEDVGYVPRALRRYM